jgi:hypothetical protein
VLGASPCLIAPPPAWSSPCRWPRARPARPLCLLPPARTGASRRRLSHYEPANAANAPAEVLARTSSLLAARAVLRTRQLLGEAAGVCCDCERCPVVLRPARGVAASGARQCSDGRAALLPAARSGATSGARRFYEAPGDATVYQWWCCQRRPTLLRPASGVAASGARRCYKGMAAVLSSISSSAASDFARCCKRLSAM